MTNSLTWVEIDLGRLAANYRAVRDLLPEGCGVMPVVKADAYGHGAVPLARRLEAEGAPFFMVATVDEALELRNAGVKTPLFIHAYSPANDGALIAANGITQGIHSVEHAARMAASAEKTGIPLKCHIAVDSGMNRYGISCRNESEVAAAADVAEGICAMPWLDCDGIYSHFAEGDIYGSDFTGRQVDLLRLLIDELAARGRTFKYIHSANSGGLIGTPEGRFNMVRSGILMHGILPAEGSDTPGIKPTMAFKATVYEIFELDPGMTVSYGRTDTADRPLKVAAVSAGYADGIPRALSNRGEIYIRGRRAKILGRVCMDQVMVDVTDIDGVTEGDVAEIFGDNISADEVAKLCDTISYEIVARIGRRVPRIYVENGETVEIVSYLSRHP